jgi:hypothetical protein
MAHREPQTRVDSSILPCDKQSASFSFYAERNVRIGSVMPIVIAKIHRRAASLSLCDLICAADIFTSEFL